MSEQQPTSTARAKRADLVRELRTGRRIPCYEMVSIAGLQYNRAVYEIRWNAGGCVSPGCPKGLAYGLNVQNDNPDPKHPDRTIFWLAPGRWEKPVSAGSKGKREIAFEVGLAIGRDNAADERHTPTTLFGDVSPDRSYRE